MDYSTFYKKFGGSARSRNIAKLFSTDRTGATFRNKRKWSMPRRSGLPKEFIRLCPWESEYLFAIARRCRIGIIETGRFNGGSCFLMACAAPDTPIYSIDIAPQNDALLRELFARHGVGKNVDLIVGDSQKAKYPQIKQADLLFVDGDHTCEGCWNDLTNWYDHLATGGHLVVHDCYLGKWGVQDAVVAFLDQHPELHIVQSPFIGRFYWHYPAGSLAHLIKRG
jgi:hypothetical protein